MHEREMGNAVLPEAMEPREAHPDIHASTQPVNDPAPDGVVDWRRIGQMLESKWG